MASSTERSKKFREKMKSDPIKLEEYKKKDRERKRSKYAEKKATMSDREREALREKERKKKRVQAEKKKQAARKKEEEMHKEAFKSPQSFGKAIRRAKKGLPEENKKKVQVLSHIVVSLSPTKRRAVLETCDAAVKRRKEGLERKTRSDALTEEEVASVQEFYLRDDISRMCPGKRDCISVKTPQGRESRQKRLLLLNISEIYELFKKESDLSIGKSKFAALRPPQVVSMTARDQEVCMCRYHENIDMLLIGLKKLLPEVPKSEEILMQTVCSLEQICCVDRECQKCGITEPVDEMFADTNENSMVSYYQWVTGEDKRVRKLLQECTIAKAKEDLVEQLQPFSRHIYNIKRQFAELKFLKENLKTGEVIIQEDFSENFQLKHQKEVMAAHWSSDMVTLFTAVVYFKGEEGELEHASYVVVSDELKHEKRSVYAFNTAIINEVKQLTQPVSKIHYWSDGAGSQFKNKYTLANLLYHEHDFGAEASWSFFETAHGKGPVDGVGGEVKRAVWRSILQNKETVTNAKEFYYVTKKVCKKIHTLFVPQSAINSHSEKLEQRWTDCRAIPNTHAIHFVAKANAGSIITAKNSQFKVQEPCTEFTLSPTLEQTRSTPIAPAVPVEPGSPNSITVHVEQYYAVDYLRQFYIYMSLVV